MVDISKQLMSNFEPYNSSEIEMNSYHLTDTVQTTLKNISSGSLPNFIVVCFQKDLRFRGSSNKLNHRYVDPGISRIWLSNLDQQFPLNAPYNFENNSYTELYKNIFNQTKISSVDFELSDLKTGFYIIPFDLSENFNRQVIAKTDSSDLQLHLHFKSQVTDLNVIIYIIRDVTLNLNHLNQVHLSY